MTNIVQNTVFTILWTAFATFWRALAIQNSLQNFEWCLCCFLSFLFLVLVSKEKSNVIMIFFLRQIQGGHETLAPLLSDIFFYNLCLFCQNNSFCTPSTRVGVPPSLEYPGSTAALTLADPGEWRQGCIPLSFNLFHFHAVVGKNLPRHRTPTPEFGFCPKFRCWRPMFGKSWIHHYPYGWCQWKYQWTFDAGILRKTFFPSPTLYYRNILV